MVVPPEHVVALSQTNTGGEVNRTDLAAMILQGMCAGDWQMPIPEGETWDDVAIKRAFKLTDKLIAKGREPCEKMNTIN